VFQRAAAARIYIIHTAFSSAVHCLQSLCSAADPVVTPDARPAQPTAKELISQQQNQNS